MIFSKIVRIIFPSSFLKRLKANKTISY